MVPSYFSHFAMPLQHFQKILNFSQECEKLTWITLDNLLTHFAQHSLTLPDLEKLTVEHGYYLTGKLPGREDPKLDRKGGGEFCKKAIANHFCTIAKKTT